MTPQQIDAERTRLENEVADAFVALRHTPAFERYEAAEKELGSFRAIYGMGDDAGYPLPDELPDDGGQDYTESDVIT